MEVSTSQPAVVVYSMNFPDDTYKLSNGEKQQKNYAVCLETQKLPIGYNEVNKEKVLLKKGEKYAEETRYKFGLRG